MVGLGDADLYRQLLAEIGVDATARSAVLDRLAAHDLVGLEAEVARLGEVGDADREVLLRLPKAQRQNVEQMRRLPVAFAKDGSPIALDQVATIEPVFPRPAQG